MNQKKIKISLILLVLTSLNTNAQFLLNSDLMIEEIDLNEQNFLPEKKVVNYRFKRNDDDQVGSGGYEFTNIPKLQDPYNSSNNSVPNKKLDIQNQDPNLEQSPLIIIIVTIIGVLVLSIVITAAILIFYFYKKHPPMKSPNPIRPSLPAQQSNSAVAIQKNETSRKINVKKTTLTQIDI
ncbi:unnamed protein product [Brachionus calyciflorus]|uniref:Uncharacterized protein n=1 Tax=Brachionus calyciflorus TaxID=104777 RepID=A0A814IUG9_9BILA|nr:unnamed protein product [Brachionus calyciflorus]